MVWRAGKQLRSGRYTIEKKLGEGGFGVTYKAWHQNLKRYVVIKTPNKTLQKDPQYSYYESRFIQEGQILAQLDKNPHIVQVTDLFKESGLWCMVMEYIDGEDLSSRVAKQGVLPETEALRYIKQIGKALSIIHEQGLVHRDVKPQNIMLRSSNSEAVLIDFGIARDFTPGEIQSHTGFLSNGYAPIEQHFRRGERGAFTDIYALAATLYVLLTGYIRPDKLEHRLPNSIERQFEIREHNNDPLLPPKVFNLNISDKVNQAVLKGMAVEPENRPQSMQQWLELLDVNKVLITSGSERQANKINPQIQPQVQQQLTAVAPTVSVQTRQTSIEKQQKPKIIPWICLTTSFICHTAIGYLLKIYSLSNPIAVLNIFIVTGSFAAFNADQDLSSWWSTLAVFLWLIAGIIALVWTLYLVYVATFAWAGILAGIVAAFVVAVCIIFLTFVVFLCEIDGSKKLVQTFSKFHTFLFLAVTSWLGLCLGWLVNYFHFFA